MNDKVSQAFYGAIFEALFRWRGGFRKEDLLPDLSDEEAKQVIALLGKVVANPQKYVTLPDEVP